MKDNGKKIPNDGELISTSLKGSTHEGRELGIKENHESTKN